MGQYRTTDIYKTSKRMLLVSQIASMVSLLFLVRAFDDSNKFLTSPMGLFFGITILIFWLVTLWVFKQNRIVEKKLKSLESHILSDRLFGYLVIIFVIAISLGFNFMVLPAYHAYQVLVKIPIIFPIMVPFVAWLTIQIFLFYLLLLRVRVSGINIMKNSSASLASYLLYSLGGGMLFMYLNSIFIVWFELRGFRIF